LLLVGAVPLEWRTNIQRGSGSETCQPIFFKKKFNSVLSLFSLDILYSFSLPRFLMLEDFLPLRLDCSIDRLVLDSAGTSGIFNKDTLSRCSEGFSGFPLGRGKKGSHPYVSVSLSQYSMLSIRPTSTDKGPRLYEGMAHIVFNSSWGACVAQGVRTSPGRPSIRQLFHDSQVSTWFNFRYSVKTYSTNFRLDRVFFKFVKVLTLWRKLNHVETYETCSSSKYLHHISVSGFVYTLCGGW